MDFVSQAQDEIGKFKFDVILSPDNLQKNYYSLDELNWDSILYNDAGELEKAPNDKRGLYAFAICHPSQVLPPHGYILYIGIAGRNSDRPLRARYKDYLNAKKVIKRARIQAMKMRCCLILLFDTRHMSVFSFPANYISRRSDCCIFERSKCFAIYIVDEEVTWLS